MRVLLALLPLLGLAFAAPAEVNKRAAMVKRAQEVMMFGNQQNRPKIAKKSDPNMSPIPESQEDKDGSVQVLPAQDIAPPSESKSAENTNSDENVESELSSVGSDDMQSTESKENNEKQDKSEETQDDFMKDLPPEAAEAIEELKEAGQAQEGDGNDKESDSSEEVLKAPKPTVKDENYLLNDLNNYRDGYNNIYQAYKAYQNLYNNYPGYFLLDRRRRRAATGKYLLNKAVKRTHRSKRDLPYVSDDEDVYFNPLYFPEAEGPYEYEPEEEVEVNPYMVAKEIDSVLPVSNENLPLPFSDEEGYNVQEIIYNGQPGYFIPARDDISFVSNEKRSPYFYPFSEEPETHYSAFIPEKRDYLDSYERLVRLARALAMRPDGRQEMIRGYEWEKK